MADAAGPKVDAKAAEPFESSFAYREELGEKYAGVSRPTVFVVDLVSEGARVAALTPADGFAFEGQPAFRPHSDELATTCWNDDSKKLGLVYCFNRKSSIATRETLGSRPTVVTSDAIARSPRWRPDGGALAYLGSDDGFDSHDGAVDLKLYDFGSTEISVLVPSPVGPLGPSAFPGIWGCPTLPEDCWIDAETLYFNSLTRSFPSAFCLKTASKTLVPLRGPLPGAHRALCCTKGGVAIVHASAPNDGVGSLLAVDCASGDVEDAVVCPPLGVVTSQSHQFDSAPPALHYEVLQVGDFEATLTWDASTPERRPLVVAPHGGPHSNSNAAYSAPNAFLASLGYGVLAVNYRGSTGFGQHLLSQLPGKCGRLDVDDCVRAGVPETGRGSS